MATTSTGELPQPAQPRETATPQRQQVPLIGRAALQHTAETPAASTTGTAVPKPGAATVPETVTAEAAAIAETTEAAHQAAAAHHTEEDKNIFPTDKENCREEYCRNIYIKFD